MKLIVAVIGTGVGEKHIQAIDHYRQSIVKIICEKDKSKANYLKKKYPKKKIITNYKEILKFEKKINLVSIASYDQDHFEQLRFFIKKKKNIIVEKPMVLKIKHLKTIKKLIAKYKVRLISNLVLREVGLFKKIKTLIKKDKIYYLEGDYLWGRIHKLFGWRSKTKDYSLTLGAAIHVIDLFNWFLNDKPTHVFAVGNKVLTKNTIYKGFSLVSCFFKYRNNIIAKISANAGCVYPHFHEIKIFQKHNTIVSNLNSSFLIKKDKKIKKLSKNNFKYPDKKNRKILIRNFIDTLIDKKKNNQTIKNQFDLLKICFAADRSLKLKKEIKIIYN